MHVSRIEFLDVNGSQVIGAVKRPDQPTALSKDLGAIRIAFDNPLATSGAQQPNVAGLNDANFKSHNVQLRLPPQLADQVGTPYIAGKLVVEDARTFRIDLLRGTRLVNQDGRWRTNLRVDCEIFLRGTRDAANNFAELADAAGKGLDGEPKPPSGGVMSGDDNPGGDFTASFSLFIIG